MTDQETENYWLAAVQSAEAVKKNGNTKGQVVRIGVDVFLYGVNKIAELQKANADLAARYETTSDEG